MRAWVLAVGSVAFVANAHAEDRADHAAPAGPDAKTKLTGNVLVWQDADFIVDASDASKTLKVSQLAKPRAELVGYVLPMKVVGMSGDLVEVEALDKDECAGATLTSTAKHLRLFVARKDIAPVVTKKFAAKGKDKSSVEVGVGVAAVEASAGTYVIPAYGSQLPVALPVKSIGYAYAGAKPAKVKPPVESFGSVPYELDEKATASLVDQTVTATQLGRVVSSSYDWRTKPAALLSVVTPCVKASLAGTFVQHAGLTSTSGLDGSDVPDSPGASMDWMLHGVDYIPAGTPLFAGKRKIGVLAADQDQQPAYLPNAPPPPSEFCYDVALTIAATPDRIYSKPATATIHACAPKGTKLKYRK